MRDGKTKHCFSVRAKYRLAVLGRAGGAGRGKLNNPETENRHLVCCVCVTRCTEPVEDCCSQGAAEVSHILKKKKTVYPENGTPFFDNDKIVLSKKGGASSLILH